MSYTIRTILAAVGAHSDDVALYGAIALARHTGARLAVVHAQRPPAALAMTPSMEPLPSVGAKESYAAASTRLELEVRARFGGELAECRVRPGPPEVAIVHAAAECNAELIVVGASRRGRVSRTLLGTTATQLLRRADRPVLVVRALPVTGLRTLVATAASETTRPGTLLGLELVESLFGSGASEVRALLVTSAAAGAPLTRPAMRRQASDELRRFLGAAGRNPRFVSPMVRFGVAEEEIATEAERWSADMVVLGSGCRRTRGGRWLSGNVTRNAMRRLHGNVLVVPSMGASQVAADVAAEAETGTVAGVA